MQDIWIDIFRVPNIAIVFVVSTQCFLITCEQGVSPEENYETKMCNFKWIGILPLTYIIPIHCALSTDLNTSGKSCHERSKVLRMWKICLHGSSVSIQSWQEHLGKQLWSSTLYKLSPRELWTWKNCFKFIANIFYSWSHNFEWLIWYLEQFFCDSNCLVWRQIAGTSHALNAMSYKPVRSVVQIIGNAISQCVHNRSW